MYSRAKDFNQKIAGLLEDNGKVDRVTHHQLRRASFSIMLNIAEGAGRFTDPDKRNFYTIARGSAFECVAILDYLKDREVIDGKAFRAFYALLEEISRMLYTMIKGLR